uniref:Protein kinase domain-containing protein n=1 Tax=Nothobranchius furzeri TaxID=105023 RepID=A0A8C6PMU9_NOTFU
MSNREQTPDLDFSKEGKINSSHLVQTKTRTGTSSIETKAEKKNTPHSDPRKSSPNDEKFSQLFSSENFEGANSEDSKMDLSIRWETDSSDTDKGSYSTDSDSTPSTLTPGMIITGNSKVYNVEEILGSGTFGEVARCCIEGQDKVVALKVTSGKYENAFLNEVETLQLLNKLTNFKHYFIKCNDSFTYQGFLCQEFELLDQTLLDYLKKRGDPFKVAEIRAIAQQMLVALSALKHLGITHTDVKLDNIMLVNHDAQPFRVKLIDFGLAFETECLPENVVFQNLKTRAPEITLGLPRDEAIDTWSLGCLLSALFLDCHLFPYENEYDNLRIIMKLLGQPDKKLLDEGTLKRGAVSKMKMLTVDPSNRILPADALKHPFITMDKKIADSDFTCDFSYVVNMFSPCMCGFSLGAPVPPTNTKNIAG